MAKKLIYNQSGFTLLEVLIALAIFGFFAGATYVSQADNIHLSMISRKDLTMHNLAELKMNETLIGKKDFTNATENDPDTGAFEVEGYEDYKYIVEITKLEFPDLAQITGKANEEDGASKDDSQSNLQKMIFENLKKNIEEMIWQVSVTVTSPDDEKYSLHSWINKSNAKLDTNFRY